jgi:hypothetical protein
MTLYKLSRHIRGSGGIAPFILSLCTTRSRSIAHCSTSVILPPVLIAWEVRWYSEPVWTFLGKRCLVPLPGFETRFDDGVA